MAVHGPVSACMAYADMDAVGMPLGIGVHLVHLSVGAGEDLGVGQRAEVHALVSGETKLAVDLGIGSEFLRDARVLGGPQQVEGTLAAAESVLVLEPLRQRLLQLLRVGGLDRIEGNLRRIGAKTRPETPPAPES